MILESRSDFSAPATGSNVSAGCNSWIKGIAGRRGFKISQIPNSTSCADGVNLWRIKTPLSRFGKHHHGHSVKAGDCLKP